MKRLKYLLFFAGLFFLGESKAQGVNLRLEWDTLSGIPAVLLHDSVYSDSVIIYNDSMHGFSGVINLAGTINGQAHTFDTLAAAIYYPYHSTADTIPPMGHVTRALTVTGSTPPFSIAGSSGVVIWPILVSNPDNLLVTISDTITTTIVVVHGVGINEIAERNLKVYMNGQQLVIQDNGEYLLKNVRLFDIAGNLLQEEELSLSGAVNMGQYVTGVYFAEINFADNTSAVVKVVNTR